MTSQHLKKYKIFDGPGVYFFLKGKKVLYIGRATSLRDRVRSYFSCDLIETRGQLIADMVRRADNVKFQITNSVLEAIILEANLIKKYQPFHNTEEKDDKSFNYLVITNEQFPAIKIIRGKLLNRQPTTNNQQPKEFFGLPAQISEKFVAGPFPNAGALQEALKFIRKIFPYRDAKCRPCIFPRNSAFSLRGSAGCKPCFNRHLGLCPGTCTGEISKKDYAKTIRYITQIFKGKKKSVLQGLAQEMKRYAKSKEFENAASIRNKIFALNHIRDVAFIKKENDVRGGKRFDLESPERSNLKKPFRIEAYDVAHLSGKNARGVMVAMENGELSKKDYRIFIIKEAKGGDDIGALSEVLQRRFKHPEWKFPDVAVVDGGQGQLNAAIDIVKKYSPETEVVSVVKDERHKAREVLGKISKEVSRSDIVKINAEAHRFAISKYRKAERKRFRL